MAEHAAGSGGGGWQFLVETAGVQVCDTEAPTPAALQAWMKSLRVKLLAAENKERTSGTTLCVVDNGRHHDAVAACVVATFVCVLKLGQHVTWVTEHPRVVASTLRRFEKSTSQTVSPFVTFVRGLEERPESSAAIVADTIAPLLGGRRRTPPPKTMFCACLSDALNTRAFADVAELFFNRTRKKRTLRSAERNAMEQLRALCTTDKPPSVDSYARVLRELKCRQWLYYVDAGRGAPSVKVDNGAAGAGGPSSFPRGSLEAYAARYAYDLADLWESLEISRVQQPVAGSESAGASPVQPAVETGESDAPPPKRARVETLAPWSPCSPVEREGPTASFTALHIPLSAWGLLAAVCGGVSPELTWTRQALATLLFEREGRAQPSAGSGSAAGRDYFPGAGFAPSAATGLHALKDVLATTAVLRKHEAAATRKGLVKPPHCGPLDGPDAHFAWKQACAAVPPTRLAVCGTTRRFWTLLQQQLRFHRMVARVIVTPDTRRALRDPGHVLHTISRSTEFLCVTPDEMGAMFPGSTGDADHPANTFGAGAGAGAGGGDAGAGGGDTAAGGGDTAAGGAGQPPASRIGRDTDMTLMAVCMGEPAVSRQALWRCAASVDTAFVYDGSASLSTVRGAQAAMFDSRQAAKESKRARAGWSWLVLDAMGEPVEDIRECIAVTGFKPPCAAEVRACISMLSVAERQRVAAQLHLSTKATLSTVVARALDVWEARSAAATRAPRGDLKALPAALLKHARRRGQHR